MYYYLMSQHNPPLENAIGLDTVSSRDKVQHNELYVSRVNNIKEYGVFVTLTPNSKRDVTGLVHRTNLPPLVSKTDLSPGDTVIVQLDERKQNGDISFIAVSVPSLEQEAEHMEQVLSRLDSIETEIREGTKTKFDVEKALGLVNDPIAYSVNLLTNLEEDGYNPEDVSVERNDGGNEINVSITMRTNA